MLQQAAEKLLKIGFSRAEAREKDQKEGHDRHG
jgi:hypothetical protein